MKIHTSIKLLFTTVLMAFAPLVAVHAQYPVSDVISHTLMTQANSNFLTEMASDLDKLDTQITHLQTIENQGQQVLTLIGNPSQALSFAAGQMGLNPSALNSTALFQSIQGIAKTVDGARSLVSTGEGIFKALPTTTPNGLSIVHDLDNFKKFDAFEQEFSNFQSILTQAQTQRQSLLTQLQSVTGSPASTEAEQSEKIARINALAAQLHANDEVIRDANEQRQAQSEANAQDSAKQKQAEQDALNTEFQQAQPQADQQADAGLSSILEQTP
jgi:chemotaxis protein histidine kinase CheA